MSAPPPSTSPRKPFRNSRSPLLLLTSPPASPPPAESTSSPSGALTISTVAPSPTAAVPVWLPAPALLPPSPISTVNSGASASALPSRRTASSGSALSKRVMNRQRSVYPLPTSPRSAHTLHHMTSAPPTSASITTHPGTTWCSSAGAVTTTTVSAASAATRSPQSVSLMTT